MIPGRSSCRECIPGDAAAIVNHQKTDTQYKSLKVLIKPYHQHHRRRRCRCRHRHHHQQQQQQQQQPTNNHQQHHHHQHHQHHNHYNNNWVGNQEDVRFGNTTYPEDTDNLD